MWGVCIVKAEKIREEIVKKIMLNAEKLTDKYTKSTVKYIKNKPSKKDIKSFKLELLRQTETKKMYTIRRAEEPVVSYKCNSCTLEENFGTLSEYYPLTNNEIFSVLSYYEVFNNLDVTILHYKLENIQAFVRQEVKERTLLTLNIPSKIATEKRMEGMRLNALFTLLHEVSHLLGNIKKPKEPCEKEADRFAAQEFKKWKHAIDLSDLEF